MLLKSKQEIQLNEVLMISNLDYDALIPAEKLFYSPSRAFQKKTVASNFVVFTQFRYREWGSFTD